MTENEAFWKAKRDLMVEEQLIKRNISDPRVLAIMRHIPRHRFAESSAGADPYGDYPVPIGEGQTISQPYIVAFMTEELRLRGIEKVFEVGTGSGYQTAVLSYLCHEVYSCELEPSFAQNAGKILDGLGIKNVRIAAGDALSAWADKAPFDRILITAAVEAVPKALLSRLKEGGTLVGPVGTGDKQTLVRITREGAGFRHENLLPVSFVPARGKLAAA